MTDVESRLDSATVQLGTVAGIRIASDNEINTIKAEMELIRSTV